MDHGNTTKESGIHSVVAFEYADATVREGATGFIADDVNKVAKQLDDGSLWVLTDPVGAIWEPIGGSPTTFDGLVHSIAVDVASLHGTPSTTTTVLPGKIRDYGTGIRIGEVWMSGDTPQDQVIDIFAVTTQYFVVARSTGVLIVPAHDYVYLTPEEQTTPPRSMSLPGGAAAGVVICAAYDGVKYVWLAGIQDPTNPYTSPMTLWKFDAVTLEFVATYDVPRQAPNDSSPSSLYAGYDGYIYLGATNFGYGYSAVLYVFDEANLYWQPYQGVVPNSSPLQGTPLCMDGKYLWAYADAGSSKFLRRFDVSKPVYTVAAALERAPLAADITDVATELTCSPFTAGMFYSPAPFYAALDGEVVRVTGVAPGTGTQLVMTVVRGQLGFTAAPHYVGLAGPDVCPATYLTAPMSDSDTELTVRSVANLPPTPFYLTVMDVASTTVEQLLVTDVVGLVLTVQRPTWMANYAHAIGDVATTMYSQTLAITEDWPHQGAPFDVVTIAGATVYVQSASGGALSVYEADSATPIPVGTKFLGPSKAPFDFTPTGAQPPAYRRRKQNNAMGFVVDDVLASRKYLFTMGTSMVTRYDITNLSSIQEENYAWQHFPISLGEGNGYDVLDYSLVIEVGFGSATGGFTGESCFFHTLLGRYWGGEHAGIYSLGFLLESSLSSLIELPGLLPVEPVPVNAQSQVDCKAGMKLLCSSSYLPIQPSPLRAAYWNGRITDSFTQPFSVSGGLVEYTWDYPLAGSLSSYPLEYVRQLLAGFVEVIGNETYGPPISVPVDFVGLENGNWVAFSPYADPNYGLRVPNAGLEHWEVTPIIPTANNPVMASPQPAFVYHGRFGGWFKFTIEATCLLNLLSTGFYPQVPTDTSYPLDIGLGLGIGSGRLFTAAKVRGLHLALGSAILGADVPPFTIAVVPSLDTEFPDSPESAVIRIGGEAFQVKRPVGNTMQVTYRDGSDDHSIGDQIATDVVVKFPQVEGVVYLQPGSVLPIELAISSEGTAYPESMLVTNLHWTVRISTP